MILAGDIGGTKTSIALFREAADQLATPINQQSFPSQQYESLDAIVQLYLSANSAEVKRACFGIAGPIVGGRVHPANLAWQVDGDSLARTIGIQRVDLINDLVATAYGIEGLRDQQLYTLNEGDQSSTGNRALIAAGTGLGMAALSWDGQRYRPIASEGGHAAFAPNSELEIELLRYLNQKFGGPISYERALSGPGLFNIYSFLRDTKIAAEARWVAEEVARGHPTAPVWKCGPANK